MTGRFRYEIVATLLILVHCSACSDQSPTGSNVEVKEPSSANREQLFTPVEQARNTSAGCKSAKQEIAAGDQALETAFKDWRSHRDAYYEARKSAFLSGSKEKDSPSDLSAVSNVATMSDASAHQDDGRLDDKSLAAKKTAFQAALRSANEKLAKYDNIGCIEPVEFSIKHREYNGLLGRD